MIQLQGITKTFYTKNGEVQAVRNASLHVEKGDIYGVIGFSGAGKSTLIRCINLLERPDEGNVLIEGNNILHFDGAQLRNTRKKIGMIFQHFNLFDSRTVYQNVAFPLKKSGLSKVALKTKVHELLKLVELSDKECVYPSQLSGGQKQRVAIARALANNPDILLCDEATSALDPQTTQSILALLKRLQETLHLTIVIITHEMAVVKAICNKVAIMEQGNIVESGKILDIFHRPQNEVTKRFINTTTSIHQVYELIEKQDALLALQADEVLVRLQYASSNTQEPLMSSLLKKFDVSFNIVFANVEIVCDTPLGNLVVKLQGEQSSIEAAIAYIKGQDVEVEVLK